MKTLSVKKVAELLEISPRAIIKRLNQGNLKGTRRSNKYGVDEWWIYPNKEIREALERIGQMDILAEGSTDEDVIEVKAYDAKDSVDDEVSWYEDQREKMKVLAEEVMKPLLEKLETQTKILYEKDRLIEDQSRQLKLLPDLEKQAEAERQAANLRALEIEALKKQIEALKDQVEQKVDPAVEEKLKSEKLEKEQELIRLGEKLRVLEKQQQERSSELIAKIESFEKNLVPELQSLLETEKAAHKADLQTFEKERIAFEAAKLKIAELEQITERPWWKWFLGVK